MTRLERAAELVRSLAGQAPEVAIVLGTGLGPLANEVRQSRTLPYSEIPGFPRSSALSHRGVLVCGTWAGTRVAVMSGRCHLYEGYSADDVAFPVRVLRAAGAGRLVVTNASGGVNPSYEPGDLMLVRDHINLMWDRPRLSAPRRDWYDAALLEAARRAALRRSHWIREGVYVAVTGPNYETRAEYRAFRAIGGDAVGMSTVPEVLAGAASGMQVLAMSMITNVARPDAPQTVDAHDVVKVAAGGAQRMLSILESVLADG